MVLSTDWVRLRIRPQGGGHHLADRRDAGNAPREMVTLIFDKVNNSRENLDWVERSPFHFIGSLVPTQYPHLLDVPVDQMRSL